MIPVNPSNVPPPSRKRPREEPSRAMLETSELVNTFCNPVDTSGERPEWPDYFKNRSVVLQKNDDIRNIDSPLVKKRRQP